MPTAGENILPPTPNKLPSVLSGIQVLNRQEIDLISAVKFLKDAEFIDANLYRLLLRKVPKLRGSAKERMLMFTIDVLHHTGMTMKQFAKFLFSFDYRFAQCALQMVLPGNPLHFEIRRAKLPNETKRVKLFITLKNHIDSNVIGARAAFLTHKAEHEREQIFNSSEVDQQAALDRCTIFTLLAVQQISNDEDKIRLLAQMRAAIQGDTDRTFTEIVFHCKMARITKHQHHIQQALALSQNCYDKFSWTLVALDIMHVLREMYAEDGNQTHIYEVINQCAFGLSAADNHTLLKRLIYLNLALTFLGINDRLTVDGHANVSTNNRKCAKRILAQVRDELFTDIEPRRNMMYCLAMARAIDNDNIYEARVYAEDAMRLASESSFFEIETRNIKDYLNYLYSQGDEETFNLPQPAFAAL